MASGNMGAMFGRFFFMLYTSLAISCSQATAEKGKIMTVAGAIDAS